MLVEQELRRFVEFANCYGFYTAKEVYDMLEKRIPGLTINAVGRFLTHNTKEKYISREGVRYLCRVIS
jgi:hypothetical protein